MSLNKLKYVILILFIFKFNPAVSQNIICNNLGFFCPEVNYSELTYKQDTYFAKFSEKPFNGTTLGKKKGRIRDGKKEGLWNEFYDNGTLYVIGEYKSGFKIGEWKSFYDNSEIKSIGRYKDGKKDGFWKGYYKDGTVKFTVTYLNGMWKEGSYNGYGEIIDKLKNKYVGEFKNGKKQGKGTYTYYDGDIYIGEFHNDKMDGIGKLNSKNYNCTGLWSLGELETGTCNFSGGDTYQGKFKNNSMFGGRFAFNGKGTYFWKNGDKYVGEFYSDKQHGKGTMYFSNGDKFTGIYQHDMRHGIGVYTWKTGSTLEGNYKQNKKEGVFTYKNKNLPDLVEIRVYENNNLISKKIH